MDVKVGVGVGGGDGGGGYGGGKGSGSTKCGRWNPTGEQVKVLTELFRSGLRTPSSDQIQKISHQLSFYGNIESKNVFYWFQNHKARERHKRRKLISHDHHNHNHNHNHHPIPIKYIDTTHQHFISPPNNHFVEMEPERMRKTLQLFPVNSVDEAEVEAEAEAEAEADDEFIKVNGKQYEEDTAAFTYKIETKMDDPPLLDLRLSFL